MLGCEGKQVLAPAQAVLANQVFSPSPDEVERAQAIVDASESADALGVVSMNGQYIDQATICAAADTVAKARAIAARS